MEIKHRTELNKLMPKQGLREIFIRQGTDKADLHYDVPYEKYLPKTVLNFLEIGIWQGGGIRAFREFYKNEGNFHGINYVFGGSDIPEKSVFEKDGFICHEGKQQDLDFLATIQDKFDVIIDDGSHHSDDQILTFKHLFKNNLVNGGLYVIEDLHCCRQNYFWNSVNTFDDTILGVALKVKSSGSWESQFFTKEDSLFFKQITKKLVLAGDRNESILFIWKK